MGTWYTVKVQPEREEKIRNLMLEQIKSKGLGEQIREILIPKESVQEIRSGKKRIVEQKTYPGYLFIEMDFSDEAWYVINDTSGVSGFVSANPHEPVPLPEEEINRILDSVDSEKEKPKPKVEFEAGHKVRIKEGPFENFEGLVEEVYPEKGVVRVVVHIFGRSTPVELEFYQVERT